MSNEALTALVAAKEAIEEATVQLGKIVIERVDGSGDFNREFTEELDESYKALVNESIKARRYD